MKDSNKKTKILVAGIGGVGGFFGGLLALEFFKSDTVEVYFLARGNHLKEIKKNGLTVKQGNNEFTAYPKLATDNPSEIGAIDYILLCTKAYDLEEMCRQIQPCLSNETIILPLLNGVNNVDVIKIIIPDNVVLGGCVYVVARIAEAGIIENVGNIQSLYFGLDNVSDARFDKLESIFKMAKIESTLSTNISTIIWEKYIFLSAIATATSYYDCTIGEILENDEKRAALEELVKEVSQVAHSKKVSVSEDIAEKTFQKLKSLPAQGTSSLHRDFQNHPSKTELDTLTGYVVNASFERKLKTPLFNRMYNALKAKAN